MGEILNESESNVSRFVDSGVKVQSFKRRGLVEAFELVARD